jgi:DNA (cytosine-5)-methyltransferase 1
MRNSGMDNKQSTLREMALFAGAGGGILGGHLLGWKTVCAVEWEPYPASVLVARQNDGILPPFPIWDDVQTFDGKPWRGLVDVVSGGFPCQDISSAGKGAGITGSRSGMWSHMARIIGEVRPELVYVENSEHLVSRGLALVISDLAAMGYGCKWGVFYAANYGAEHVRPRLFLLADANMPQRKRRGVPSRIYQEYANARHSRWGKDKPGVDRTSNVVPARVDRLKAIGNAQVPIVAATAFRLLRDL